MYRFALPRFPGRNLGVLVLGGAIAAVFVFSPAAHGEDGNLAVQAAEVSPSEDLLDVERDALLARAQSLEALGHFLWTNNLSESKARYRASELREVARVLLSDARSDVKSAETPEEQTAAQRRLEVLTTTSALLEDVADRIAKTRGTRRKLRILGLELSRQAWTLVRRNDLPVSEDGDLSPGRLFKDNQPPDHPRTRAYLKETDRDYLTYNRGAVETDVLERRFFMRTPRQKGPVSEEELYYSEGELTLSPLDRDSRSLRIWWTPPPEELAWTVEQW
jgi:hypothetical protein